MAGVLPLIELVCLSDVIDPGECGCFNPLPASIAALRLARGFYLRCPDFFLKGYAMTALPFASLGTLLISLFVFITGIMVAGARSRYGIKAPAVTGHEIFERTYRVQMNTLEQIALILPALWLFAAYVCDVGAGIGALVWVLGRSYYAWAYVRDPAKRGPGFGISMAASGVLWLGALVGIVLHFMHH